MEDNNTNLPLPAESSHNIMTTTSTVIDNIADGLNKTSPAASSFTELGVREDLQEALSKAFDIQTPNPLQTQVLPVMLQQDQPQNVLISSREIGKISSVLLTAFQALDPSSSSLQILVFCPCRELTFQTRHQFQKLKEALPSTSPLLVANGDGIGVDIKIDAYAGGIPERTKRDVIATLKTEGPPHILCTSPGYVQDLLEMGEQSVKINGNQPFISLQSVKIIVFVEASNLLRPIGFEQQFPRILPFLFSDSPSVQTETERDAVIIASRGCKPQVLITTRLMYSEVEPTIEDIARMLLPSSSSSEKWCLHRFVDLK
jgi:superfamily II DNA/RNA helicase